MLDLLDRLLAPLARILVAHGVPFSDFAERMKAHFLAAAASQSRSKVTDSRLSVMTGLHRRDVTRLREFRPKEDRPNPFSRLIAVWRGDPAYSPEGSPRVLPRNGPEPSFETLARDVLRDVHPRTLLDTLVASGTVGLENGGSFVRLLRESYQPLAGSEDQLAYLARNVGDHLEVALENVQGASPPHFERAVHYTGLTDDQVAEIRKLHDAKQMALLIELSEMARVMKTRDGSGHSRFRAGAYFYTTKQDTP